MSMQTNREDVIKALRSGRHTQLIHSTHDSRKNHFCFIGLIGYVLQQKPEAFLSAMTQDLGLPRTMISPYVKLNNSGVSLGELADRLIEEFNFPDVTPDDYINELLDSLEKDYPPESYTSRMDYTAKLANY